MKAMVYDTLSYRITLDGHCETQRHINTDAIMREILKTVTYDSHFAELEHLSSVLELPIFSPKLAAMPVPEYNRGSPLKYLVEI